MSREAMQLRCDIARPGTTDLRDAIFKLSRSANDWEQTKRNVQTTKESAIWAIIQNAIDETVLPRELTLLVDGTAALHMSVYRRNLFSLQPCSAHHTAWDAAPDTAQGFATRIRAACASGQSFSLATTGPGRMPEEAEARCSGRQLMNALNSDLSSARFDDPLNTLLSLAQAFILIDAKGIQHEKSGSEHLLNVLRKVSETQLVAAQSLSNKQRNREQDPQPTCLIVPYRNDTSIGLAELCNKRALFVIDTSLVSSSPFQRIFQ